MTDDIKTRRRGSWGIITLDRPKHLNSLTKEMCEALGSAFAQWADEDDVRAVMIEGAGDRAFCAGGDIKALYETGRDDPETADSFFRTEYAMNTRISQFSKPYVALLDGVCMGGGVGISQNASHKIVTERTVWAMPECAIGLIPDVGTSHVLPTLPDGLGNYLALTGARLEGADCLAAEVATHLIPQAELAALKNNLLDLDLSSEPDVEITELVEQRANRRPGDLTEMLSVIGKYFAEIPSFTELLGKLEGDARGFGGFCLDRFWRASPTSLLLTHRLLADAPSTFEDCISREFNVVAALMRGHDFYEGVRAVLIDKDGKPTWSPAKLSEIDPADLDRHFDVPETGPLALPEKYR